MKALGKYPNSEVSKHIAYIQWFRVAERADLVRNHKSGGGGGGGVRDLVPRFLTFCNSAMVIPSKMLYPPDPLHCFTVAPIPS